jgi:hypothetical protein
MNIQASQILSSQFGFQIKNFQSRQKYCKIFLPWSAPANIFALLWFSMGWNILHPAYAEKYIFWVVKLCSLVNRYQYSGEISHLHFHGRRLRQQVPSEYKLPNYIALHLTRLIFMVVTAMRTSNLIHNMVNITANTVKAAISVTGRSRKLNHTD